MPEGEGEMRVERVSDEIEFHRVRPINATTAGESSACGWYDHPTTPLRSAFRCAKKPEQKNATVAFDFQG